jgi:predicted small lipoprotein YifL
MNTTTKRFACNNANTRLTTRLRYSLMVIALAAVSGCGQKGPLILERIPVAETQAPLENTNDEIPLVTPVSDTTEDVNVDTTEKPAKPD